MEDSNNLEERREDKPKSISSSQTQIDIEERVAGQIGPSYPLKIRLTAHDCYSQQPKPHPIKFRDPKHLQDMLVYYNQACAYISKGKHSGPSVHVLSCSWFQIIAIWLV